MAENHRHTHGHTHHHSHGGSKGKIMLIAVAALLLTGAILIEKNSNLTALQLLPVYLVPYLLIGYNTLREAGEGIAKGNWFNEHFLMSLATVGALCIGFLPGAETEFPEAVFVMLFFQIGELFEDYAEGRSRDSISHLMDIRPDTAHVERNGSLFTVSPDEVKVGENIVVRPGEKIPLDVIKTEGSFSINSISLSLECMSRTV